MPLARTADLVSDARARGRAVGAVNAICLEHVEATVAGAERAGLPVVIQISENAVAFREGRIAPLAAACVAAATATSAEVALHLDHVRSRTLLDAADGLGFSSLMFDASTEGFDGNVTATREAVAWGRPRGLWVEAELGEVGGKDGAHAPGARTDPAEAAAFVDATGVDGLAVAVGSSHAMTTRTARLDQDLIRRLAAAVPVPLVLHGSSGIPEDALRAAVAAGIVKVNVGTALNVALTRAVRTRLDADPAVVDPRRYLGPARSAMADVVAEVLTALAAPGRAPHRAAAPAAAEGTAGDA